MANMHLTERGRSSKNADRQAGTERGRAEIDAATSLFLDGERAKRHHRYGITENHRMSELDVKALEANFDGWRAERAPDLTPATAFERYCIELILKDADLSDDEISSGHLGGGNDGGIDGMYFFVNRQLVVEETILPANVLTAQLWIIQAKNERGFGETPITKIEAFCDDVFNFSKSVVSFTYYNEMVRESIASFRTHFEKMIGQPHKFTVLFAYASKSDQDPNPNVQLRVNNLKKSIHAHISAAEVDFQFWGARNLTNAWRNPPNRTLLLDISKSLMADDGSVVCLARLDKFAEFLTDENGRLRQYLLEPNVRDYAGERNPVNTDIRNTLSTNDVREFWWLNNGVTILADKCAVAAGKVEIVAPELVNGLQTSHEIYNHFSASPKSDDRTILVRVVLPPDEQTRRRVVKATNNQTPVSPLSLRATDDIHFDIEELLKLYQIWYDRRKGEYRRLKKPISQIVSIKVLAQAVMAISLRRPDEARARPMSLLKTEEGYSSIFEISAPRELFLAAILLDRQVWIYLSSREDITKDIRTDIRYYMDMWLASYLSKKEAPSKADLAGIATRVKSPINMATLDQCSASVLAAYTKHGGDARAAKGPDMRNSVMAAITATLNE
jgi:hypothetical protein